MHCTYHVSVRFFGCWLGLFHDLKIFGRENLPRENGFILAANHVSFADPPVIGVACAPRAMHFMAKKELFQHNIWGWWFKAVRCIPIARNDRDIKATKEAINALKSGRNVAIFPEGTRSVTQEFQEPELGAGFLATKAHVPVVPIYISGTNKVLPKGGKYTCWNPVRAFIGKPINPDDFPAIGDRRKRYESLTNKIMASIAELKTMSSSKGL
ncbi:MAG: lysophospholipid acyltransferase family protein [Candidatus Omnitrophica bacterium]|nr:lysophospholipid acyltransferase family protein [Candidatus Omnitrophota bacterium]